MRALALASLLLAGCNALFGLSEAELRDGTSGATSTSGSGGGGGAASSSSSGSTGGSDATSSSSSSAGGGEEYVGCADLLGTGGGGGSCTVDVVEHHAGGQLTGWQVSGSVLSMNEAGEAFYRLDASGGTYVYMRQPAFEVFAGDEICLAARTRVNEGAMMAQPHLTAWVNASEPLVFAAELSVDYAATSFAAREASAVVAEDGMVYLELSVQGDTEPATVHLDADDITLVIRRCN